MAYIHRYLLTYVHTVSFHNFKSQNFQLSVSNPKSKCVAYVSVLSRISDCQGLGRKNKFRFWKLTVMIIMIMIIITIVMILMTIIVIVVISIILIMIIIAVIVYVMICNDLIKGNLKTAQILNIYIHTYIHTYSCIYIYIYMYMSYRAVCTRLRLEPPRQTPPPGGSCELFVYKRKRRKKKEK